MLHLDMVSRDLVFMMAVEWVRLLRVAFRLCGCRPAMLVNIAQRYIYIYANAFSSYFLFENWLNGKLSWLPGFSETFL